jgi:hypothetical protein
MRNTMLSYNGGCGSSKKNLCCIILARLSEILTLIVTNGADIEYLLLIKSF